MRYNYAVYSIQVYEKINDDDSEATLNILKNIGGQSILKEGVKNAITKMKPDKAIEPDIIPMKIYQVFGKFETEEITKILNHIYNTGKIHPKMRRSMFITIPKKPEAKD